jgi:transposase
MEESMAVRRRLELAFPNAAGIDVGGSVHYAALPPDREGETVRPFGVCTADLNELADWLLGAGVDTVAMESTGVYWIPVYEVLERRGLRVLLVNARHVKHVPGRKSDVLDCQWLQQLMSYGLLQGAFRPEDRVCVVRAVCRHRDTLIKEQSQQIQRMQKALVQMNLQLTEVLSDVVGASGQAIIRAIVAGERDPHRLASLCRRGIKAKPEQVARALQGTWREEHVFVLGQALGLYDAYAHKLAECDAKLEQLLAALACFEPQAGPKRSKASKGAPKFDLHRALMRWCGVDLTRIDGLQVTSVLKILAEIGTDLSRFKTVKHFCSWLGICPGTKISGGKRLSGRLKPCPNRVKQAFKIAAMSLAHSHSALGGYYRRMCARKDKAQANAAAAHKLARLFYFMLTRGQDYVDRGEAEFEQRHRQRVLASLKRRAAEFGMQLLPQHAS